MKKLLVIAIAAFLVGNVFAGNGSLDFVATENGTEFFKKVRHGVDAYLVGVKPSGEKIKYSKEEVLAYTKSGKHFEKMPVIADNKITDEEKMMQLVKTENGLRVFKYASFDMNGTELANYYIFKNRDYVVEIDKDNFAHLAKFF